MSEHDEVAGSAEEVPQDGAADRVDGAVDRRRTAQRGWWIGGIVLAALIGVVAAVVLAGGDDEVSSVSSSTSVVDTGGSVPGTGSGAVASSVTASATTDEAATGSSLTDGTATGSSVTEGSVTDSTMPASTEVTPPAVTVPVVTGSLDTVVVNTVVPAPPVSIDEPADTGAGMTFRLERVEAVQGEAAGPGEIAAPAVRVTVMATNEGREAVLLETVVVDLQFGPVSSSAAPLSGPGGARFTGVLQPVASATGVYVFDVPVAERDDVSILVSYLASVPPVVFQGPVPTA